MKEPKDIATVSVISSENNSQPSEYQEKYYQRILPNTGRITFLDLHYNTYGTCSGITLECALLRLLYTIIVRMKHVLE